MNKKCIRISVMIIMIFSLFILNDLVVEAGTKDMVATKRTKFKDDGVESMRDVFARKEAEEEEYRQKMLANGNQTIDLLRQVRDLLIQLNKKK